MMAMDLIRSVMESLSAPEAAELLLYVVNALIGFIFGLTLIYINRVIGRRQVYFIVPMVIVLYVATFLLNDILFALRLIQIFLLAHIAVVGFHAIRKGHRHPPGERG